MTNSFIIVRDSFDDYLRISTDDIAYYGNLGNNSRTTIKLKSGPEIEIMNTVEKLDQLLAEVYITVKKNEE